MKEHTNGRALNLLGCAAASVMAGSALRLGVARLVSKL
jgi:hypothetical protein